MTKALNQTDLRLRLTFIHYINMTSESKIKWHLFFRTRCTCGNMGSLIIRVFVVLVVTMSASISVGSAEIAKSQHIRSTSDSPAMYDIAKFGYCPNVVCLL